MIEKFKIKKGEFNLEQKEFILSTIDQWCLVWRDKIKDGNCHSKNILIKACEQLKENLITEIIF